MGFILIFAERIRRQNNYYKVTKTGIDEKFFQSRNLPSITNKLRSRQEKESYIIDFGLLINVFMLGNFNHLCKRSLLFNFLFDVTQESLL